MAHNPPRQWINEKQIADVGRSVERTQRSALLNACDIPGIAAIRAAALPLPEVTFPLSIDTIGMMLATGHELSLYCDNHGCHHTQRLNLVKMGRRLGFDHSCMAPALKPHVWCVKCAKAGKADTNISFRSTIPSDEVCGWPRGTGSTKRILPATESPRPR